MKNTFGNSVTLTIFGESHGEYIGAVLDGIAPGLTVDKDFIAHCLSLRRPEGSISTPRREQDNFCIASGTVNGKTTGTPLTILIPNNDTKSADYGDMAHLARPGHADLTAEMKYHGFQDIRGGGHFSGRITAAIVAAGSILISALKNRGIYIGTHVKKCAGISDRDFTDYFKDTETLLNKKFAVLDEQAEEKMKQAILDARSDCDSVGGILETVICGLPSGLGEPWFDSVESVLSHAMFSIPAVKGVEFGDGFALADMRASESNDSIRAENGRVYTETNHMGGINGGITNSMPIIMRCAVKPTPTIFKTQKTVDYKTMQNADICAKGRHDPAIVHRARIVADSLAALCVADMLAMRFGTDYIASSTEATYESDNQ